MATIPGWDSDQLGDLRLKLVLTPSPTNRLIQAALNAALTRAHLICAFDVELADRRLRLPASQHRRLAGVNCCASEAVRDSCGFDPFEGAAAVPTEYACTRFQRPQVSPAGG